MIHDAIVALAVLGVVGQALLAVLVVFGVAWLFGLRAPLRAVVPWTGLPADAEGLLRGRAVLVEGRSAS
jgi:hypothetical protein